MLKHSVHSLESGSKQSFPPYILSSVCVRYTCASLILWRMAYFPCLGELSEQLLAQREREWVSLPSAHSSRTQQLCAKNGKSPGPRLSACCTVAPAIWRTKSDWDENHGYVCINKPAASINNLALLTTITCEIGNETRVRKDVLLSSSNSLFLSATRMQRKTETVFRSKDADLERVIQNCCLLISIWQFA